MWKQRCSVYDAAMDQPTYNIKLRKIYSIVANNREKLTVSSVRYMVVNRELGAVDMHTKCGCAQTNSDTGIRSEQLRVRVDSRGPIQTARLSLPHNMDNNHTRCLIDIILCYLIARRSLSSECPTIIVDASIRHCNTLCTSSILCSTYNINKLQHKLCNILCNKHTAQ